MNLLKIRYITLLYGLEKKMKLKIRQNGKYYQIGYNKDKRWIQVYQIGTPEKLLKKLGVPIPKEYQHCEPKKSDETNE